MVSKSKELVKGIVKNVPPKSTYGTDPNDPWSAKAGIAENVTSRRSDLLKKFYKAKGYNIDYVSKNKRVGQAKTGEFDKWKSDHGIYEEDAIDEAVTYEPSKFKPSKTSAGHTIVGHSFHSNGTKHANIVKHGETGKYFDAGGSSDNPVKSTTFHDSPEEAAQSKKSYVKEEDLNELNKDTVYSYSKKADKDVKKKHKELGAQIRADDSPAANKTSAKIKNRYSGLDRADDRLQKEQRVAEEGYGNDPSQRVDPRTGKKYVPPKSPLGQSVAEGEVVPLGKKHRGDLSDTHSCPKCGGDLHGGKYMGHAVKVCQPCKQVYLPPNSGIDQQGNKTNEQRVAEDNINDPQSACQSPFDGANTTDDVAPKKSKAGKMVKEIYAKHRLKEDLYDHEKDDKGPGTYGKSPKVNKKVEVNDTDDKGVNARMVLKGGTTLTGEKRDTIEIDPMMKNRSKTADYLSGDAKKQQLRTK